MNRIWSEKETNCDPQYGDKKGNVLKRFHFLASARYYATSSVKTMFQYESKRRYKLEAHKDN